MDTDDTEQIREFCAIQITRRGDSLWVTFPKGDYGRAYHWFVGKRKAPILSELQSVSWANLEGCLRLEFPAPKGDSLRELVTKFGWLDEELACVVLRKLAQALNPRHMQGFAHGELAPEILWFSEGAIALLPALTTNRPGRKNPQVQYLAPEGLSRQPKHPHVDVWAMGLIAFYLFTGKSYWLPEMKLSIQIPSEKVAASVRARTFNAPELPPWFDAWFAKCLALQPSYRFATCEEAAAALQTEVLKQPSNIRGLLTVVERHSLASTDFVVEVLQCAAAEDVKDNVPTFQISRSIQEDFRRGRFHNASRKLQALRVWSETVGVSLAQELSASALELYEQLEQANELIPQDLMVRFVDQYGFDILFATRKEELLALIETLKPYPRLQNMLIASYNKQKSWNEPRINPNATAPSTQESREEKKADGPSFPQSRVRYTYETEPSRMSWGLLIAIGLIIGILMAIWRHPSHSTRFPYYPLPKLEIPTTTPSLVFHGWWNVLRIEALMLSMRLSDRDEKYQALQIHSHSLSQNCSALMTMRDTIKGQLVDHAEVELPLQPTEFTPDAQGKDASTNDASMKGNRPRYLKRDWEPILASIERNCSQRKAVQSMGDGSLR